MTHITYKTAKALKEFLGESAPEPMAIGFWKMMILATDTPGPVFYDRGSWYNGKLDCWAYQLHDLLSKPFCEAFLKVGIERQHMSQTEYEEVKGDWARVIGGIYFEGGLTAVEEALEEMMK